MWSTSTSVGFISFSENPPRSIRRLRSFYIFSRQFLRMQNGAVDRHHHLKSLAPPECLPKEVTINLDCSTGMIKSSLNVVVTSKGKAADVSNGVSIHEGLFLLCYCYTLQSIVVIRFSTHGLKHKFAKDNFVRD